MRVVHLSCLAPPETGGIGRVASREVALLRARGVDARLIAPEPPSYLKSYEAERSFIEHVKPKWRFGNAAQLPDISALVKGADIVHLHYPFYGTAEPLLLSVEQQPPTVITFHMDATAPGIKGALFTLHRWFVQPSLLGRAKRILVSSFDYARRSSLASFFARHPERVVELPFGVNIEFFSPGSATRHRFVVPESAPTILFVGGLDRAHAFKGLPQLLQALFRLDAHTHLLVVGDGDLRSRYEEQARSLALASRVHFLGRLDDETLRDAYRSADVFAFPSINAAEAFGLAALEAESCGLPVVASDLPGVRTIVRHGDTGLLVPPKDVDALTSALERLLKDQNARSAMSERCVQFVHSQFSWDKHVDGLMQVYREVCASRS